MDLPSAPNPRGNVVPKFYSEELIEQEAIRLTRVIKQPERWTIEHCKTIAPYTLEINQLKKEKEVYLIAHSYQTPDIVYGVADEVSDPIPPPICIPSIRSSAITTKDVSVPTPFLW